MADPPPDPHPWRVAVLLGLVTVVAGMAYTILIVPAVKGWGDRWAVPGEVWPPIMAARWVANGALPYLYEADRLFVATPLGAVVLAPVVAIGDALGLTGSSRFLILRPTLWLVYGPYALALCSLVLVAVRRLAHQAWWEASGAVGPPSLASSQLAAFALVLAPAALVYTHFEDVLALAFAMLAVHALLRDRSVRGALLLGVAIGFKQWAAFGLPLLVAQAPPRARLRALAAGVALPAILVGIPLLADWSHASRALFEPLSFPRFGHAPLWIDRSVEVMVGTPFRAAGLLPALGLAWWLRGRSRPATVLAAFALAFLARIFFEPVVFGYYLCPGLSFLFLHERATGRSGWRTVLLGSALMLAFPLHPNPVLWWAAEYAMLVAVALPALAEVLPRLPGAGERGGGDRARAPALQASSP